MAKDSAWDAFIGGAAIVGGAILLYKLLQGGNPQRHVPMCPRCGSPLQTGSQNCPNCNMPLNWV